jgi:hypothetical protein
MHWLNLIFWTGVHFWLSSENAFDRSDLLSSERRRQIEGDGIILDMTLNFAKSFFVSDFPRFFKRIHKSVLASSELDF